MEPETECGFVMTKLSARLAVLFAAFALFCTGHVPYAHAHGGVSAEGKVCVMKIGPYKMFFTGYQPERAQSEEFCDDIPYEGRAIVVLDHVDSVLREMPTDFRILKDVNNLGVMATLDDLGSKKDIEAATLMYEKPKLYPRGTFQFELNFPKGIYIGMVTIEDKNAGKHYVSVFPFTVGYKLYYDLRTYALIAVGLMAVFAALALFVFKGYKSSEEKTA